MERRDTSTESVLLERRKEVASGRRGSMCGHAIKGTAKRVEEKSSARLTTKGTGAL